MKNRKQKKIDFKLRLVYSRELDVQHNSKFMSFVFYTFRQFVTKKKFFFLKRKNFNEDSHMENPVFNLRMIYTLQQQQKIYCTSPSIKFIC